MSESSLNLINTTSTENGQVIEQQNQLVLKDLKNIKRRLGY